MNARRPDASGNEMNSNNRADSTVHNAPTHAPSSQDAMLNDSGGGRGGGAGGGASASTGITTGTATMVLTDQNNTEIVNNELPVLRLQLRPQPRVTWDQQVVNNEGMGRKSSKRCCIFHKAREFGESSTESSEDDSSSSSSGGEGGGNAQRPMAQKKNNKKIGGIGSKPKVPDYQRFHA